MMATAEPCEGGRVGVTGRWNRGRGVRAVNVYNASIIRGGEYGAETRAQADVRAIARGFEQAGLTSTLLGAANFHAKCCHWWRTDCICSWQLPRCENAVMIQCQYWV